MHTSWQLSASQWVERYTGTTRKWQGMGPSDLTFFHSVSLVKVPLFPPECLELETKP